MAMGQRPLIAFAILAFNFQWINSASIDANVHTNCTLDDLRNINDEYKFRNSPRALSFIFSDCNVTSLPNAFFMNVSNSKSIEFLRSNISKISPFAFTGLAKLESLTIVENPNLTALQSWTANNLDKLMQLNLNHNSICDLDTFALRRYPKLLSLNLQDNFIAEIPVGFFDFSLNIETLNLARNSLERIESFTFKALLRLVDLNLAYNQLKFIDSYAFTTVTRLKTLRLNGNQLNLINSMVFFNLAHLEYLNLSENALNDYALQEDAFQQNIQLIHLDVSHNSMIAIQTYALNGLKALQVLNASHNQIASIPSIALKGLDKLKHLDVSHNKLTHILDNQFSSVNSIESINISHNELNSIQPFTFSDLNNLETLDLASNQLQTDGFIEQAAAIKSIDLQNNQYHEMNLTSFKSIGNVYLNNNPWNCSWLMNALAKKEHLVSNVHVGFEFDGFIHENLTKPLIEEVECLDYRHSTKSPLIRKIVIFNLDCDTPKNEKKKKPTISTYPRTFSKLLNEEFDYKACLLWTVVAVFLVIGLVRLGKYCLDQSEKKSEQYRIVQQEKVLKDIDDYFAKNNKRKQRS